MRILIGCMLVTTTAWCPNFTKLATLMQQGIKEKIFPGAVVVISHHGNIVYHKAFGHTTYAPHSPRITTQTLFDVASLTKLATTTAALLLCEQQQLSLNDRVCKHLPAFAAPDKKDIRLYHLLTHTSGLDDAAILASAPGDDLVACACSQTVRSRPGAKFAYNDSDMLMVQAIIETITQQPFEQYLQKNIFQPLGMRNTCFNPTRKDHCAPTRASAANRPYLLQGEVDDDRAYNVGGIAGHAGVFSTAADFERLMRMFLHEGAYEMQGKKKQCAQPTTIRTWTSSQCNFTAQDEKGHRGYGFEIGRHLSDKAFGHFGWTGTSVWADRDLDLVCVLFTNSVHPSYDGREKMKEFRVQFHTLIVESIKKNKKIMTGAEQPSCYLPLLANKRVALLTNHTACVGKKHLVDVLRAANIKISKIFTPEHGFRGGADAGAQQHDSIDEKTGIPLISLYGKKTKPTAEDLADVDILIFDMQDVGARFYTYISSLQNCMEAAVEHHKPLIILDRPNPNGFYVDGPVCEFFSFVGKQPIPIVHGMTVGEYAQMLNGEQWLANKLTCDLTVIPCKNYTHKDRYKVPLAPSPNLKNMNAVYLYPSLCLFEGTRVSIGRGTEHPFELFCSPQFPPTKFSCIPQTTAGAHKPLHEGTLCYGYSLINAAETTRKNLKNQLNLAWLQKAYKLYPDKDDFFIKFFTNLAGNKTLAEQIRAGMTEEEIRASWEPALSNFKSIRKKYLLYEDFE